MFFTDGYSSWPIPFKGACVQKTKVAVLQTGAKKQLQVEKPIQTDL